MSTTRKSAFSENWNELALFYFQFSSFKFAARRLTAYPLVLLYGGSLRVAPQVPRLGVFRRRSLQGIILPSIKERAHTFPPKVARPSRRRRGLATAAFHAQTVQTSVL